MDSQVSRDMIPMLRELCWDDEVDRVFQVLNHFPPYNSDNKFLTLMQIPACTRKGCTAKLKELVDKASIQARAGSGYYPLSFGVFLLRRFLVVAFSQISKLLYLNRPTWEDGSDFKFAAHRLNDFS